MTTGVESAYVPPMTNTPITPSPNHPTVDLPASHEGPRLPTTYTPAPDWSLLEAQCLVCGGTFIPADEDDTIHLVTDAGDDCGGQGVILGERWAP